MTIPGKGSGVHLNIATPPEPSSLKAGRKEDYQGSGRVSYRFLLARHHHARAGRNDEGKEVSKPEDQPQLERSGIWMHLIEIPVHPLPQPLKLAGMTIPGKGSGVQ